MTAEEVAAQKELFKAIETGGELERIKSILADHPQLINMKYDGETPIDSATRVQEFRVIEWLVTHGAIVTEHTVEIAEDAADQPGMTNEEEEVADEVLMYLQEVYDAASPRREPLTAEEVVAQKDLFKYITLGDRLQLVKDILTRHPKLINLQYDDETPLEVAVDAQDIEVVRWLIENGADVSAEVIAAAEEFWQNAGDDDEDDARDILRLLRELPPQAQEEPLTARELEEQKVLFDEIDGESSREIRAILTQYPRLLNREFDADGDGLMESPLRRAVHTQNINLIRTLVDLEADVTPQILQYQREIVDEARPGEQAAPTAILRLLEGMEEEEEEEEEELTMAELVARKKLHDAIETGDNVTAKAILAQHPKLANIRYNDETPLTNAVSSRNLEFVKHLVDNGVYADEDDIEHAEYLARDGNLTAEEKKLAEDIAEVIRARVAARPVVPPLNIPPRALDFGDEPALPALEVTEIEYKELPDVFDMTLNKDIPIFDALAKRRIIFTVDDSYYGISLGSIESSLKDKTSTFYECKKELDGAAYTKDVHIDTPYFRLTLNGNFTVTEKHLRSALASECSIFELVPNEKKLAFVSSYRSVQVSPGRNGLGEDVNIVSADHCQKGSNQFTYDVKAVTMVKYRTAEQKEVDRVEAEKKAVEDAAVAERMKQEAVVRKKAQEEQAARVAARGSGRRRTYRKGKKSTKGKKSNKRTKRNHAV